MIYSTNGRLDAGIVFEVEKSLGAGLAAVAMERVNARHNVSSDRVKIKPNTVVMVERGGRTYKVKVEHYISPGNNLFHRRARQAYDCIVAGRDFRFELTL